ncbi:leucine-rich repeat-containing protein 24 [Lingula anatina]|uniref:Leucine-rich repeat-containing protein 24 n=1 Tax=Lingula anatina TaxID=7574 RepID=A0A1S3JA96_LINAN|nr:leucine-rich repeat-containing protein 24 [Lingula anatina]XP_013407319.1 leucine-rich repeat-containing protein 24 [Lingula anatina]XP_013407320.1 leucine-rich repeat-containing protein 24 [Lingula anatina]XP_013407321.1 leucine-rich repeat-containing protein 24 [Lingula anatina]XP_013407322.1 leucine-rich repeat-containing protein 24 [Lingula anatina]XP_013407324.1 leucine-rich repeat-containing protein 24 [Lingula anatina]|eukprot:XP_013407318.1 leucine-rich repeat-containing protein 24 [Lingula anatina]
MMAPLGPLIWVTFPLLFLLLIDSLSQVDAANHCNVIYQKSHLQAHCQSRNLHSIPKNLTNGNRIHFLFVTNNRLESIGNNDLDAYPSLQEVYFENNRIKRISRNAFHSLRNLILIDLEGNDLKYIPEGTFQNLNKLRELNLGGNAIARIDNNALILPRLEKLSFAECKLTYVAPEAFSGLGVSFTELNLAHNSLARLDSRIKQSFTNNFNILRIYGNPWNCDCHLRWLRHWLVHADLIWEFGTNVPMCDSPLKLKNQLWSDVEANNFACSTKVLTNGSSKVTNENSPVSFDCVIYANPKAKITWFMNGTEIQSTSNRYNVTENGLYNLTNTLHIKSAHSNDSGVYKCLAENLSGQSEATFNLKVYAAPPAQAQSNSHRVIMGVGMIAGITTAGCLGLLLIVALLAYSARRCLCPKGSKDVSPNKPTMNGKRNGSSNGRKPHSGGEDHELQSLCGSSMTGTTRRSDLDPIELKLLKEQAYPIPEEYTSEGELGFMGSTNKRGYYPHDHANYQDPYEYEDQHFYPGNGDYYPLTDNQLYPQDLHVDHSYPEEPGYYRLRDPDYQYNEDNINPQDLPPHMDYVPQGGPPEQYYGFPGYMPNDPGYYPDVPGGPLPLPPAHLLDPALAPVYGIQQSPGPMVGAPRNRSPIPPQGSDHGYFSLPNVSEGPRKSPAPSQGSSSKGQIPSSRSDGSLKKGAVPKQKSRDGKLSPVSDISNGARSPLPGPQVYDIKQRQGSLQRGSPLPGPVLPLGEHGPNTRRSPFPRQSSDQTPYAQSPTTPTESCPLPPKKPPRLYVDLNGLTQSDSQSRDTVSSKSSKSSSHHDMGDPHGVGTAV